MGNPYKADEYKEIYKKGKERYDRKVPPGYMDIDKNPSGTDQFGDLVLWMQILDFAKDQVRPIILITDDAKEDWWREIGGEKLGPRPELIEEFIAVAGEDKWFYMYSTEQFLRYAQEYLSAEVTPQALKEAEGIEKQDAEEEMRRKAEEMLQFLARVDVSESLAELIRHMLQPVAIGAPNAAHSWQPPSLSLEAGHGDRSAD